MWRCVAGASDFRDTSVSSHDDDRGLVALKSSVKEGETLDIEHVYLIDEEDTGDDLSTPLFSPLGHLLVNLFTDLRFDLTNITSEESHEALRPRVDHIDLVECHCMHDLLSLLKFAFGALDETSLRTDVVKVTATSEGTSELGDLATGLVNGDNVSSDNLLLRDRFYHLGTQVVDRLHLCCLEGDFSCLSTTGDSLVDLNVNNFTLNDLGFFSDSHTYDSVKRQV